MIAIIEIWFDFGDYAGFVPGLAISVALALVLGPAIARRLLVKPLHAAFLVVALGVVLSVTVTPSREALMGMPHTSGGCDLSRVWIAPWSEYSLINDSSLNVALFLPLGVLVGMLPASRYRRGIVVAAVLLPIAIEMFQLVAAPFGRACQSEDVVDNLMGLLIGLGIGLTTAWLARRM